MLTDSSFLVISEFDLEDSNIPDVFDENVDIFHDQVENFGICTEGLIKKGESSEVGAFNVKLEGDYTSEYLILNKVGKTGDSFFYPVQTSGRYCFYGYHASEEPGIRYSFYKPYGSLDPADQGTKSILTMIILPFDFFTMVSISVHFIVKNRKITREYKAESKDLSKSKLNTFVLVSYFLFGISSFTTLYHQQLLNDLKLKDAFGYDYTYDGIKFSFESLLQITIIGLYQKFLNMFYSLATGSCGILKEKRKCSKKFMIVYYIVSLAKVIDVLANDYQNFSREISNLIAIIATLGNVVLYAMIWKSSKTTGKQIRDIAAKRKFNNSAKLIVLIPTFLEITSISIDLIMIYKISEEFIMNESSSLKVLSKTFTEIFSSSIIWSLFSNLSLFSLSFIVISLYLIWGFQSGQIEYKEFDTEVNNAESIKEQKS